MKNNSPNNTKTEVRELDVAICHPNPWNKERPLDAAFLHSVKENGQLVIALVRPHPSKVGQYEIIFGARRHAALVELGESTIVAEVRTIGDDEAMQICAIENKQRTSLTWRQELEQIEEYLRLYPEQHSTLAAALGISVNQVRRRHKLLEKLSKSWMKCIKAGKFGTWTVDHFESLTLLTEQQQETFYNDQFQWEEDWIELKKLREILAEGSHVLKAAPWDLADATLCPKAGACIDCPKRSGANTDLFDEVDPKVKGQDRCLDNECYRQKNNALRDRKVAEAKQADPEVLVVSKDRYRSERGVLGYADYEVVKKSTEGAKKAVLVDGEKPGKVVYVKADDGPAIKSQQTSAQAKSSLADKIAAKNKQRDALAIQKLMAVIEDEANELEFTEEAQAVLTQYCVAYGVPCADFDRASFRVMSFKKRPYTDAEMWLAVASRMLTELQRCINQLRPGTPAAEDETVQLCAWMVDVDFAELREQAAAELPDPKSWGKTQAQEPTAELEQSPKTEVDDFWEVEDQDLGGEQSLDSDGENE